MVKELTSLAANGNINQKRLPGLIKVNVCGGVGLVDELGLLQFPSWLWFSMAALGGMRGSCWVWLPRDKTREEKLVL